MGPASANSLSTVMITPDKTSQKSMTGSSHSVHYTNFLWALDQEFLHSTTQRFVAAIGAGIPFFEI